MLSQCCGVSSHKRPFLSPQGRADRGARDPRAAILTTPASRSGHRHPLAGSHRRAGQTRGAHYGWEGAAWPCSGSCLATEATMGKPSHALASPLLVAKPLRGARSNR